MSSSSYFACVRAPHFLQQIPSCACHCNSRSIVIRAKKTMPFELWYYPIPIWAIGNPNCVMQRRPVLGAIRPGWWLASGILSSSTACVGCRCIAGWSCRNIYSCRSLAKEANLTSAIAAGYSSTQALPLLSNTLPADLLLLSPLASHTIFVLCLPSLVPLRAFFYFFLKLDVFFTYY
jgi:hypothetical protein